MISWTAPAVERVTSGDELSVAEAQRAHVLEFADLVVAAREELQQRPVALSPADALRQQSDERLRAGDESLDALGAVGSIGMGGEIAQLLPSGGEHPRPGLLDDRLIEGPETHAAGELADDRIPQLRRHDEPVERLVEVVAEWVGQRLGMLQASVEERHHGRNL